MKKFLILFVFGSEKSRVSIAGAGVGSSQCAIRSRLLFCQCSPRSRFCWCWISGVVIFLRGFLFIAQSFRSLFSLPSRPHRVLRCSFCSVAAIRAQVFNFSRWSDFLHPVRRVFCPDQAFLAGDFPPLGHSFICTSWFSFLNLLLFTAGLASTLRSSTAVGSILLKLARICSLF
jgi:hypothetical protein